MSTDEAKRKAKERLETAEAVIKDLRESKYENVQHYVFNARLDVRTVVDPEPFEQSGTPKEKEQAFLKASIPRVYVTTAMEDGSPYFRVYGCGDVLTLNDNLYGQCVGVLVQQTYASVGLDTDQLIRDRMLLASSNDGSDEE